MVPVHSQEWGNSIPTVPDIRARQLVDAVRLPRLEAVLVEPSRHCVLQEVHLSCHFAQGLTALPLECLDNGLDNSGGGALWAPDLGSSWVPLRQAHMATVLT